MKKKALKVKDLAASEKNMYGELDIELEKAVATVFPDITVNCSKPGCYGHPGTIRLNGRAITVPNGTYKSGKHFHTAGNAVVAVESGRIRLNKSPLMLISGRAYNGDYRALKKTYYLLGRNEDGTYFLHRVRPIVGQAGDMDTVRAWMWQVKDNETLADRQGDLGFIRPMRQVMRGEVLEGEISGQLVKVGNHAVFADRISKTSTGRVFVENPRAVHGEHHEVKIEGVYELRVARRWENGWASRKGD